MRISACILITTPSAWIFFCIVSFSTSARKHANAQRRKTDSDVLFLSLWLSNRDIRLKKVTVLKLISVKRSTCFVKMPLKLRSRSSELNLIHVQKLLSSVCYTFFPSLEPSITPPSTSPSSFYLLLSLLCREREMVTGESHFCLSSHLLPSKKSPHCCCCCCYPANLCWQTTESLR